MKLWTYFSLKVVPDKLQRVVQRMNRCALHLHARLLFPRTLHHCGEDLVRPR